MMSENRVFVFIILVSDVERGICENQIGERLNLTEQFYTIAADYLIFELTHAAMIQTCLYFASVIVTSDLVARFAG